MPVHLGLLKGALVLSIVRVKVAWKGVGVLKKKKNQKQGEDGGRKGRLLYSLALFIMLQKMSTRL